MNIDHLRSFLEAAITGSFLEAANGLNVSQSTLSARIKALEERLDCTLFERSTTGVELSAAGQRFHSFALQAVQAWDLGVKAVKSQSAATAQLRLGIQIDLWELIVDDWLFEIRERDANHFLQVDADHSDPLVALIYDGLLDLALICVPRRRRELVIESFVDLPLIMVSNQPRQWSGWLPEDYILVNWGEDFKQQHGLLLGLDALPATSVSSGRIAHSNLLARGGTTYLLEPAVRQDIEAGRLFPVEGAPQFTQHFYTAHARAPREPALLEIALQALQEIKGQLLPHPRKD